MIYLFFTLLLARWEVYFTPNPNAEAAFFTEQKSLVEWAEGREHDFGDMRQNAPQTYVFRFKNLGEVPILLETVRTSCGCTAARWTETAIAAGQTGEVSIEYDAYQTGDFNKKIRVFFDRQRKPEVLRIRGNVRGF